jgi:hypothetical protein
MGQEPGEWIEVPLPTLETPMSERAIAFLDDGIRRMQQVDCFDFVPSNYKVAWSALAGLPRGRFCEWGSGLGIAVGLAEILGHDAIGIELDADLAEESRALLRAHGLSAIIETGSYFERVDSADYVYVYAWPSQRSRVLEYFLQIASDQSHLLFWEGQDDLRLRKRLPNAIEAIPLREDAAGRNANDR